LSINGEDGRTQTIVNADTSHLNEHQQHTQIITPTSQDTFSSIAMASTTNPDFGANTEATEVAKAFTDGIRGKTVLITGVNRGGIGFATAQAFVSPPFLDQILMLTVSSPLSPRHM
jgi:hypothetical protein